MMKHGISAVLAIYNSEKVIKRCLESIKDVVDEIIIVHDGPCSDKTLNICKKYTKNFFVRPHKGSSEAHQVFLYKKARYEWVLKIDGDEFLSKDLRKNIRKLIENQNADAYSFIWPFWDKDRYITGNWPRKTCLYRKLKISFISFPNWGEPIINGNIIKTNLKLEHKPPRGSALRWGVFKKQALQNAAIQQAKATLRDFGEFEKFHYNRDNFPIQVKIRKHFPILSAFPFAVFAFFLVLYKNKFWKEGDLVIKFAIFAFIYYLYLGYLIFKMKNKII